MVIALGHILKNFSPNSIFDLFFNIIMWCNFIIMLLEFSKKLIMRHFFQPQD